MKTNLLFVLFIASFLSCNTIQHDESSISISEGYCEIPLTKCADSVWVKGVKSSFPLSEITSGKLFDDNCFFMDSKSRILYYMRSDSIVSMLNSFGRGHGEYESITSYAYNEDEQCVYVYDSGKSQLLKYSVPDFSFISSSTFELRIIAMEYYNQKLLAVCSNNLGKKSFHGIYEISLNNGSYKLLRKMLFMETHFIEEASFFRDDEFLYLVIPGYDNTICRYDGNSLETISKFFYGSRNLESKIFTVDENKAEDYSEALLTLMTGEYSVGGYYSSMRDSSFLSFWHATKENEKLLFLITTVFNGSSNSYSLMLPDLSIPIVPCCNYNGLYISIIENNVPELTDNEYKSLSVLEKTIIDSLKKQSYDNPVLVYYKLKEEP